MISVCLCLGMNSTWLKRSFRNYLSARRQERGAGYLLIFIYLFCKLPSCIWDRKNWCHGIFWKDLLWTWLETKHQSWDRNLQITRRRNQRLNLRQPWGIRRAMGLVRERCRCCCMNLLGHGIASYEVLCKRKGYTAFSWAFGPSHKGFKFSSKLLEVCHPSSRISGWSLMECMWDKKGQEASWRCSVRIVDRRSTTKPRISSGTLSHGITGPFHHIVAL